MKFLNVKRGTALALSIAAITTGLLGSMAHAEDTDPNLVLAGTSYAGDVTGHIDVVSKYILRGITQTYTTKYDNSGPESDQPAVQGGLDYNLKNGLYVGYWFSSLGYSYASLNPNASGKHNQNSVENDFYAGYNGKIGDVGYTLGGTMYVYEPGWNSTGFETKLGLNYGEVAVTAQTLLNDVTFGNVGDTYFVGTWTHALPKDFTFTAQVGAYLYNKHGDYIDSTDPTKPGYHSGYDGGSDKAKTFAFRQATLGLTHPLPIKGATWGVQYIFGGDNRYGVQQGNQLVGSLGLTF